MATSDLLPSPIAVLPLLPPASDFHARFSREAYHRMIDAGVIDPESRVELIDGEIFMMLPLGPPQGSLITRLMNFFIRNLPEQFDCRVQMPIVAGDHSEPEPDIAIVRRKENDYRDEHPLPSDVALLIEVSYSSLKFDLGRKLQLYAENRITEYWVIDGDRQAVLVHRNPSADRYESVESFNTGSSIAPLAEPECRLDLTWLFR
jgi:Uma2 family endonuclease